MMKLKSEENLQAAKLLVQNKMYSASVHGFYYSVFQLSKYVLCNSFNITYEDQENQSKGKDSHFYVIDTIKDYIDKQHHIDMLDYMRYINKLKSLRKKADYSTKLITPNEAMIAEQNGTLLNELLSKY